MLDDLKYIDKLVRKKMASHAVESTVDNFSAIQRIAFWKNFFSFRLKSFNAYYSAIILLFGITSFGYLYATNNTNSIAENQYQSSEINIIEEINTDLIELENNTEKLIISKEILNKNNTNTHAHQNNSGFSNTENSKSRKADAKLVDLSKSIVSVDDNLENELHNTEVSNESEQEGLFAENEICFEKSNQKDDFISSNITADKQASSTNENSGLIISNPEETNNSYVFSDIINLEKTDLFFIEPIFLSFTQAESYVPSFRSFSDSIDYYLPPAMRSQWMVGLNYSSVYSASQNSLQNSDFENLVSEKNRVEEPDITFSTGVSVQYQGRKKFGFQTGLSYSELGNLFSRNEIVDVNNTSFPLYPDGGFFNVDSVQFFNLDSLLQGVEHIETIYDSAWVVDNTIITNSDTSRYAKVQSQNRFSYVEIPLMLTYKISNARLDYQFKLGMTLGYLIEAEGKKLNLDNKYEVVDFDFDSPDYNKMNYSIIGGIDIYYRFHKRFSFSSGIMYRRTLSDIYSDYPYNLKFSSTQINFGLHYHL